MRLLTLDLGTSAVKAAVWNSGGLLAMGRARVETVHDQPGHAEQNPAHWWAAIVHALAQVPVGDVSALGFSTQRETVVPLDAHDRPLRPAMLWSDSRAWQIPEVSAAAGRRIGATAGLVAWLARWEPESVARATWLAGPRDLAVARLTGVRVTDETCASRTGLWALSQRDPDLAVCAAAGVDPALLPNVVPSHTIVGEVLPAVAAELGLPAGMPVVVGAGDRACEVLGVGATALQPMLSWGTTANLSVPTAELREPACGALSAAATGGALAECGLSAAGSALAWLAGLCRLDTQTLSAFARQSPVGARGVGCVPWLSGARAPWWQPGAHAAFAGIASGHEPGDLARALYEGVAHDVRRCLAEVAPDATSLLLAGGGSVDLCWQSVLGGVTGRELAVRDSPALASVGAALLTASAMGQSWDRELLAPQQEPVVPHPADVEAYAGLTEAHDQLAAALLGWPAQ